MTAFHRIFQTDANGRFVDGLISQSSVTQHQAALSIGWAQLSGVPSTFAPSAHASTHQHNGTDEIATATAAANAIPKAGSGGTLATGWIPDLSATYQTVDAALTALLGVTTSGLIARTGTNTYAARTITAGTNHGSFSNGNGVAGNPTYTLPQNLHTGASPLFAGLGVGTVINTTGQFRQGPTNARYFRQIVSADTTQLIFEQDVFHNASDFTLQWRYFRSVNTTGAKTVLFFRGNNTTDVSARIGVDGGNSAFCLDGGGNFGIGLNTYGSGADRVFAQGLGTAPGSSPADAFQMYAADIVAGNAAPHFRTENGAIIKLHQVAKANYNDWAAFTDVVNALVAIGLFDAA